MPRSASRREFLQTSAAVGVGYWISGGAQAQESRSPNEKVQVACIGIGGKGRSDADSANRLGKVVALCDVDTKFLDGLATLMKVDNKFVDYREMFEKLGDKFDAVMVSTPDHTHAVISAAAMRMGKHVYCQKPLTRTIWEARRLAEIAKEHDCVTQMGNQWTAYNPMRKAAYQVKQGMVGNVSEVHVWTDRPVWPQGGGRPEEIPVPETLDWAQWLGPAAMRPYGNGYHPFEWRGWWDFGTGALGDMACHTCNLPFMALNMRDPVAVEAQTAEHNGESYPKWSQIVFDFPELDGRAAFKLYWYDGGKLPDAKLFSDVTMKNPDGSPPPYKSGCVIVGDKGKLYAAGDYAQDGIEVIGTDEIKADYPRSRGHDEEFFDAIRNPEKKPMSNFVDYSGPLTETILLGNLAVWKQGRVEWDAKTMTPLNDEKLMQIVKPEYHNGYELI